MALSIITSLGYEPMRLEGIHPDWSRVGLGISDDVELSSRLSTKFFYSNTFFDAFPNLDIRKIPKIASTAFEFVSCSDVLEHIDVDIDEAIRGISRLLKPDGFAVLSVPITRTSERVEFYPNLKSFSILGETVKWMDHKGNKFIDDSPEFHGGRGQNLAFRQFTHESFKELILDNGFGSITNGWVEPKLGVPDGELAGVYVARL
jgi:SAM-dependent methyltransferase